MEMEKLLSLCRSVVGDRLTDEEVKQIAVKITLREEEKLETFVTPDPHEFEGLSRRKNELLIDNNWNRERKDIVNIEVLFGDYLPGLDDTYEYLDDGDNEDTIEEHVMSDFSLNQVQVALIDEDYSDTFNEIGVEEHAKIIAVYLPEEKAYPDNLRFKEMVLEERAKQLFEEIKKEVRHKLNDKQIKEIVEKINLEGEFPEVEVIRNPDWFETSTRPEKEMLKDDVSDSYSESVTKTDVLLGDYEPGKEYLYEHVKSIDATETEVEHEMGDFFVNKPQVALVDDKHTEYIDYSEFSDSPCTRLSTKTVVIYIPNERLYRENLKFSELVKKFRKKDASEISEDLAEKSRISLGVSALNELTKTQIKKDQESER